MKVLVNVGGQTLSIAGGRHTTYTYTYRNLYIFFYLGFLSRTFTIHETAGEGGGYLFNSSLPLPPASQTLRHQPGDYCRELTSAHSWQLDSNREPLVSERKSLITKLRALSFLNIINQILIQYFFHLVSGTFFPVINKYHYLVRMSSSIFFFGTAEGTLVIPFHLYS